MADFGGPPVGTTVNPVGQGMQTLSDVMGFKQKQQALQTGQYTQQSAQANAQQDQQKNQELQSLAQFTKSATQDPKYHNPDGSLNVQKFQTDASAVAPTYGQDYIGKATLNANAGIDNRKALLGLSEDQRKSMGSYFNSVASNPNATVEDFTTAVDRARTLSDDPQYQKSLDRMLVSYPHSGAASDAESAQATRQFAAGIASQTSGAAMTAPSTIDNNAAIQPGATNRYTGGFTPSGAAVQKQLSPTDQPAYKQTAAAASATGASRATGVAGSDIDRANQVSANIKPAQAGIQTTQQIDDLADQIHSGKFAAWVSKGAASVGISEATYARQLLEKDLGIIKTQMTTSASSDSRAATILSGTPEATSDPQTIHGAMDYVRGSFRQNMAQGNNLAAYKAKHPDLSGFQGADDAFTGGGGPLVHEFLSLKGKDQQAAFYRRNFSNPQQALEFRNKVRASAHTLGLDNADDR